MMPSRPTRQTLRVRGFLRGPTGALGIMVVLAVLMLPATAQAAAPTASLRAPYYGTWSTTTGGGFSGCGTGYVRQPAMNFSLVTGVGHLSERSYASDRGCTILPAYSTANGSASVQFVGASFTTTAGAHTIVTFWSVAWQAQVSAVSNGTLSPPAACAEFFLSSYVEDQSGRTYTQSNPWSPGAVCLNLGNLTVSGFDHVAIYTNATLAANTVYYVVADLQTFTGVFISALGTSAMAWFNVGSGGHYAKLVAVQIR